MKVQIQDYEVEIFAKYKHNNTVKKSSTYDTFGLLNWLIICMNCAAERQLQIGYKATAKEMKKSANSLFNQLKEKGYYNKIQKG